MAITEDIELTHNEGWRAIVLTGTNMALTIVDGNPARYRLGITSTSMGMDLHPGDVLIVAENLYVLANQSVRPYTKIAVTQF